MANPLTTGRIHTYHLPAGKLPLAVGVILSWRFEDPDHLRAAATLLNEEANRSPACRRWTVADVTQRATRYEFLSEEAFEPGNDDIYDDAITVEWRGGDRWAISRGHGWTPQLIWFDDIQSWEYEPRPSDRDDEILARCRYSFEDAMGIAAVLAMRQEQERKERGRG